MVPRPTRLNRRTKMNESMTREEIEKRMDKHLKPLVLYHQDSTSCLSGSYNTLHKDKWPRPQNHVPTLLHTPRCNGSLHRGNTEFGPTKDRRIEPFMTRALTPSAHRKCGGIEKRCNIR